MFTEISYLILIFVFILFPSIVLHEYAHGWVAYKLGDATAKQAGRLTLNPLKHIDLFGTIILPGVLIFLRFFGSPILPVGFAKPVPVNFFNLRNPKRDMMLVGLAGPAMNVMLAFLCAKLLMSRFISAQVAEALLIAVFINLLLATFNMLPIPPLDGSRLVMGLLPRQLASVYARIEPFGILIVILLVSKTDIFERVIGPVVEFCGDLLGVQLRGLIT